MQILELKAKADLLRVVEAYRKVQPGSETTLSREIYGASWFIDWLRGGQADRSISLRKYDEVIAEFAKRWPEGARWPKTVPHPPLDVIPVHVRGRKTNGEEGNKGKKANGAKKANRNGRR